MIAVFSALNFQGHEYSFRWNLLALCLLLLLTIAHLFTHKPQQLRLSRHYALLSYTAFMLWALSSLCWSAVPSDSLLAWLTLLGAVFALYLGYQINDRLWQFCKALLLPLTLIVAGYTLYQSLILNTQRPAGFLLNWNSNAAFIALLALPYCATLLQTKQTLTRHMLGLFLFICAMAIASTQSRGGLLALLIGLAPLCWLQYRHQRESNGVIVLLAYLTAGFVATEILQNGAFTQRINAQIENTNLENIETLGSGRHALWAAAWQMYLDKPWLGWGLGMYHWLYPQYRDPMILESGQLVHNDYLEILMSLGPVGLLLLLAFVICVLRLFLRAWRNKNLSDLALAGSASAILLHSLVEFNLFQPAITIILGLYVGHLSKNNDNPIETQAEKETFSQPLYLGLSAVGGLALSIWFGSLFAGFYYSNLALKETRLPQRLTYLEKAQKWLPYMDRYYAWQASFIIDALKQELPEGMTAKEYNTLIQYALNQVNAAISKNSLHAANYRNLAELLETSAKTPEQVNAAMTAYRQALYHDPYDLESRYRLANLLEQQQREVEAYRLLFAGLDKAYFTNLKTGMGFLLKIHQIIETTNVTPEQKKALEDQLTELAMRSMKFLTGQFILRGIGINPPADQELAANG